MLWSLARKPNIRPVLMHGDKSNYLIIYKNARYHLVIPTVPRKGLPMQDLACCDYFRTPAIFKGPDNLVFVGVIAGKMTSILPVIPKSNRRF